MSTTALIILIAVIVIAAAAILFFFERRRSAALRNKFGPEYDRAVRQFGTRTRAEKELEHRAKRISLYQMRSLSTEEQDRFSRDWQQAQARFVDDPALAIRDADRLVCDVMKARGYPMVEFDRRAEDLSVDHPNVVRNYRAAHEIALAEQAGRATTEDLRRAMVSYRELFDELLEMQATSRR